MATENDTSAGDFSDRRVFLIAPGHPEYPFRDPSPQCRVSLNADGPTYVAISATAADRSLERISELFRIPLQDLIEFRAAQAA